MSNYSRNDWRSYSELYHGKWSWPDGNNSKEYNQWYYKTHPEKWAKYLKNPAEAVYDAGVWAINKGKEAYNDYKSKQPKQPEPDYHEENGVYIGNDWKAPNPSLTSNRNSEPVKINHPDQEAMDTIARVEFERKFENVRDKALDIVKEIGKDYIKRKTGISIW